MIVNACLLMIYRVIKIAPLLEKIIFILYCVSDYDIVCCVLQVSDYGIIRLSINASLIRMVARGCNGITNEGPALNRQFSSSLNSID